MKAFFYLAWESIKVLGRQRGQLAFMIVVPMATFFAYMGIFAHGKPDGVAMFLGPCLALLVTTHGMYGVGIDLLIMREMGMLLPYQLTPVLPAQILLSRLVVNCLCGVTLAGFEITLAILVYGVHLKASLLSLVLVVALGDIALGCLGMFTFSVVNGMDEANFLAQIIFFVLFVLSGISAPLDTLPHIARIISAFLPTTLLIEIIQGMMVKGAPLHHWWPELVVITSFITSCMIVAIRLFRWSGTQRATRQSRRIAMLALLPLLIAGIWFNLR